MDLLKITSLMNQCTSEGPETLAQKRSTWKIWFYCYYFCSDVIRKGILKMRKRWITQNSYSRPGFSLLSSMLGRDLSGWSNRAAPRPATWQAKRDNQRRADRRRAFRQPDNLHRDWRCLDLPNCKGKHLAEVQKYRKPPLSFCFYWATTRVIEWLLGLWRQRGPR